MLITHKDDQSKVTIFSQDGTLLIPHSNTWLKLSSNYIKIEQDTLRNGKTIKDSLYFIGLKGTTS